MNTIRFLLLVLLMNMSSVLFSQTLYSVSHTSNPPIDSLNFITKRTQDSFTAIHRLGVGNSSKSLMYSIPHQLYIPLLYAYQEDNEKLKYVFKQNITYNLLLQIIQSKDIPDLYKIIYYFFNAEFLRVSDGISMVEKTKMHQLLSNEVYKYWCLKPAKVWKAEYNNFIGKKDRVNAILKNKYNGNQPYYNAITDNELFLMATGVSLAISGKQMNLPAFQNKKISDMFYQVFEKLTIFNTDGTWYFQPNQWMGHPDFNAVKLKANEPLTWDTSHFSRFPAYINLLSIYYQDDEEKTFLINNLREGLAKLFVESVVEYNMQEKKYFFRNYISGNNSFYRKNRKKSAVPPYSNNIHFYWGWWKLLKKDSINTIYCEMVKDFSPYQEKIKKFSRLYFEIMNLKIK